MKTRDMQSIRTSKAKDCSIIRSCNDSPKRLEPPLHAEKCHVLFNTSRSDAIMMDSSGERNHETLGFSFESDQEDIITLHGLRIPPCSRDETEVDASSAS